MAVLALGFAGQALGGAIGGSILGVSSAAIGGFIDVDPQDTIEPIRRLKKLAADRGFQLIPGHDPHVWPELTDHFQHRFGGL